ncbi:MAG: ATP-binding cassette domain-containing protein [Lentimicrobium sp.]|jgi:ABC-type glutathione transport system ATPase component|nr:ATP-binding cassette domain-containing protein [Lentimicrobium sp.]
MYRPPPLLRVEQLSVEYESKGSFFNKNKPKPFKAVNQVNLDVFKGETLGLVGESGSGKTTLGRAILRLTEPSKGQVWFDNIHVNFLSAMELKNLHKRFQIIFQAPYSSLNPRITVGDNIPESLLVRKLKINAAARQSRVFELLERVGL